MNPNRASAQPLGNTSLTKFDMLIIGSGAGGASAAAVLTRHGLNVLILEAGPNYYSGLDNPDSSKLGNVFSQDTLKHVNRNFIFPDPIVDPRNFRQNPTAKSATGEVNHLPQIVGGAAAFADLKTPRFSPTEFKLGQLRKTFTDTTFSDWPVDYDMLEPFYSEMEQVMGVQGDPNGYWYEGARSKPLPMKPGAPMYLGLLASEGAKKQGYRPFAYPGAVNSQSYDGRNACIDCGLCVSFGCVNGAKGGPAVTTLRKALLTGRCLVLPETKVTRILKNSAGNQVTGVEAITPNGERAQYSADRYILSASPIESSRLLFLSDPSGPGLGNSSGWVGRNLMFHYRTITVAIFEQRIHSHRGRTVSHGIADFRGEIGNPDRPQGGIVEFGGSWDVMDEVMNYAGRLKLRGSALRAAMKESPFRDRMMSFTMHGEDAPQFSNRIDLDPSLKDADGIPAARITYKNHKFELNAGKFYAPKMLDIMGAAGAHYGFVAPAEDIPATRHIMGTLRMGTDPRTSVCDRTGRFHDIENLYASDGSLFPTSGGFNPTLTIAALATRVGAEMVFPGSPERALLA